MRNRPRTDPYEVLGVPKSASDDEIRRAYRDLALRHHPDRNGGSAESTRRFGEIAEAHEVLTDSDKRAFFDRWGVEGPPRRKRTAAPPTRPRGPPPRVFIGYFMGCQHFHEGEVTYCLTCGLGVPADYRPTPCSTFPPTMVRFGSVFVGKVPQ